jgi:hypothetical protein
MQLTRNLSGAGRRLVLLAPSASEIPAVFYNHHEDAELHDHLLREMQRLRGRVYLQDGAIEPSQLTRDGRHSVPADSSSWHVLTVDAENRVLGCARYLPYPNSVAFVDLGIRRCPLAQHDRWSGKFRNAVETQLSVARRDDLACVEVGGWALAEDLRASMEALRVALSSYALAYLLGGCIGFTTATTRHSSSSILRRLGGKPLVANGLEIPSYYDPQYNCEMEMLCFDSRQLNPRYRAWAEELQSDLMTAPVVYSPLAVQDEREVVREHHVAAQQLWMAETAS